MWHSCHCSCIACCSRTCYLIQIPPWFAAACKENNFNVSVWQGVEDLLSSSLNRSAAGLATSFEAMPKLDSLFFPGGDGGTLDWPEIADVSQVLRSIHPNSGVWVSAQELSSVGMELFWANVSKGRSAGWLAGVVYGPHVRVPLTEFVRRANAAGANVRQYPDITHTLSDQFPLPRWHPAWSLTHGRQAVCPLPEWSAQILRLRANGSTPTIGVGAYSEGVFGCMHAFYRQCMGMRVAAICHCALVTRTAGVVHFFCTGLGDDLNKIIWSSMAADPALSFRDVTAQYARYFFGAAHEALWVEALIGLEVRGWLQWLHHSAHMCN